MTELLTKPQNLRSRGGKPPIGIRHGAIEGGFIKFTVHQLILLAWLHQEGHISRRQWRICFAACEMRERRRHGSGDRKPCYQTDELVKLIGGEGTGITADLKHLARLGLLSFTQRHIDLAVSVDQITLDDISGFWDMYEQIPNRKRPVPVPRRTVRALAAGFSRGVMVTMIAMLIRALFWHQEHGTHRLDGRVKRGWIADLFGITPRAITTAMSQLIEMGWISRIECNQFELNKWGGRYAINPDWTPADQKERKGKEQSSETSTPNAEKVSQSSTLLNQTPFPKGKDIKTRRPEADASLRPGRSGVFNSQISKGGRPQAGGGHRKKKPRLTDVQHEDLRSTERLLMLYDQAIAKGLIPDCEAGRLDFVALAERAAREGNDPAAMFVWLLKNKCFDRITLRYENAARQRLRSLFEDPMEIHRHVRDAQMQERKALKITEDERVVQACLQTAKQTRFEPHVLARELKGWSRQQWDDALDAYNQRQFRRFAGDTADRVLDW